MIDLRPIISYNPAIMKHCFCNHLASITPYMWVTGVETGTTTEAGILQR
jgi:hypothetical protein